jgi:outer membrane receptor protein involved in Fe transport
MPAIQTNVLNRNHAMDRGQSTVAATVAMLLAASLCATQAAAAEAQSGEATEEVELSAVVVTGSRIVRRDYESPTPVVTIGAELLEQTPDFAIETKLRALPQFAASGASQFNANPGTGGTGAATLNLRGIGDNRNLVLLDGRRLMPSTSNFAIDVNTIPASLLENVETITGGASAVYGSDAISGVVNFKTRTNFSGVRLDLQRGSTFKNDMPNTDATLTLGGNFADDRGNAVFAINWSDRGTIRQSDREFYRRSWATAYPASPVTIIQGTYNPTVGGNAPQESVVDAYFATFGAPANAVSASTSLGFNNDGTLFNATGAVGTNIYNFTSAVPLRQAVSTTATGGKVVSEYSFVGQELAVPVTRTSLFTKLNYRLTDYANVYLQGYNTHYDSVAESGPIQLGNFWAITVPRNASHPVPTALATILDSRATPGADWVLFKTTLYTGQRVTQGKSDISQLVGGVNGALGLSDWTYDVNGSSGRSQLVTTGVSGFLKNALAEVLFDAPNYGAGYSDSNGTCTSGVSPFGTFTPSQDCIDYMTVNPKNRTELKQDTAELNLQGGLFALPAGDVRAAVGASWRKNTFLYRPDDAFTIARSSNQDTDFSGTFVTRGTSGAISVKDVYAEVLLPLLRGARFAQSLEMSLGYRVSDYSVSGSVDAYKADLLWTPVADLKVRGGFQHAVRGPNVNELFQPPTPQFGAPVDNCRSTVNLTNPAFNNPTNPNRSALQQLCRAMMGAGAPPITDPVNDPNGLNNYNGGGDISTPAFVKGNPLLDPESANTVTAGFVFQPQWQLPLGGRMSLSVDYYDMSVKDAIASVSSQATFDYCYNANGGNPTYDPNNIYCRNIGRDQTPGNNGVTTIVNGTTQNQGRIDTDGIDLQFDVSGHVGPGQLRLNSVLNHIFSFKQQAAPGQPQLEYAGHTGYYDWRLFNTLSYQWGPMNVGLRWQHMSSVQALAKVTSPTSTNPDISAYDYFDLTGNYRLTDKITFGAGVSNLFDKVQPETAVTPGSTDAQNYDILGRRYFVRASVSF